MNFQEKNIKIGQYTIIEEGAEIGNNVQIGNFCIIHSQVKIGANTIIRDYVELRSETLIGEDCYIDSKVTSSGKCQIGNNVILRYESIIARGAEIGDHTFFSARVMMNNLDSDGQQIGGAKIGSHCFIGTNAVFQHGVKIGNNVTIGSMSFVNKDCDEGGTYFGIPAIKYK
jgi:UDP-3-O-[3-hydroxymyristoyl] glucosamine N-acyltransferase